MTAIRLSANELLSVSEVLSPAIIHITLGRAPIVGFRSSTNNTFIEIKLV